MRYPIDFLATFDKTLLFWMERFIKLKLTTLSNRNVKNIEKFNAIIQKLNKGVKNIEELKLLAKEARQCGLIGINTYINPLQKLYTQLSSLGFASMKELSEETLIDFLATYTSGLSDATKKNYRMAILSFFKYVDKHNEDDEGKSYNYRIELKNLSGLGGSRSQKLPVYMHDEEIQRFLKAIDETPFKEYAQAKNRLLIKLILYTGMRVSEALEIQTKEMVKEDGYFIFRVSGKGNKQRVAMIKCEYIQKNLDEWLKLKPNSALLFCSRTAKPLTQPYVSYIMDKMLLYAGIRKEKNGAHMLRHTFATRLYQKNHDLILVQEALGHADLNTSRIYTHFDKQRLKAATSVMDDFN